MICTQDITTNKKASVNNRPSLSIKKKMEARWQEVNGKLVCRWVEVETIL